MTREEVEEIKKYDRHKIANIMVLVVGGISMLIMLLVVIAVVFIKIPEGNKEAFAVVMGIVSSMVSGVIGYYFGSSQGSDDKTHLLKQASNG